jgi:hypothetical protein
MNQKHFFTLIEGVINPSDRSIYLKINFKNTSNNSLDYI